MTYKAEILGQKLVHDKVIGERLFLRKENFTFIRRLHRSQKQTLQLIKFLKIGILFQKYYIFLLKDF